MQNRQPDWAALYIRHRDAMWRVAAATLRSAGLTDDAGDAVQDAMLSLIKAPPQTVTSWEAVMVTAAKRRALDRLRSAAVRHDGPELTDRYDPAADVDVEVQVGEALDRQRAISRVRDHLTVLDDRHRLVVREYVELDRPRADVAAELGVTPARISQMAKRALEQLRDTLAKGGTNE